MSGKTAVINLALSNAELYAGCEISEAGGAPFLATPVGESVNVVGRNARDIVERMVASGIEEVTLTGAMAIWAYLVVFHASVHRFSRVYYKDGKQGERVLIAAH